MATFPLSPYAFLLSDLSQVETGVAEIFGTTFTLEDTEAITIADNGDNIFFADGVAFNDTLRDSVDPDPLTVSRIAFLEFTNVDDEDQVFRTAVIVPAASAFTFVLAIDEDNATVRGALPTGVYRGAVIDGFTETLVYNTAPAPQDDALALGSGRGSLVGSLLANNGSGVDADPDGDSPLTVIEINDAALPGDGVVTLPSGAVVTVGADGGFTYVRAGDAALVDSFEYRLADPFGASATAIATVTVAAGGGDGRVVATTLAAADGAAAIILGAGDAISFEGARFDYGSVDVVTTPGGATLTIGGRTVALEGDFTGGDFIVSTAAGRTLVELVDFAPDLEDEVEVDAAAINGVASTDYLTGDGQKTYSAIFQQTGANFDNAIGAYDIAPDGTIGDVRLLFANAKTAADGDSVDIGVIADGHRLGFFLIQDGAERIAGLSTSDSFSFTDGAAAANALTTDSEDLQLVRNGAGIDAAIAVLHSVDRLNFDEATQVLSGAANDATGRLFVGFEDLTLLRDFDAGDFDYDTSDRDFNDVTMFVQAVTPAGSIDFG